LLGRHGLGPKGVDNPDLSQCFTELAEHLLKSHHECVKRRLRSLDSALLGDYISHLATDMLYECPARRPGEGEDIAGLPLLEVPPIIDWDAFFVLHRSRETALKLLLKPLKKISGSKLGTQAQAATASGTSGTGSLSDSARDLPVPPASETHWQADSDPSPQWQPARHDEAGRTGSARVSATGSVLAALLSGASGTGLQMLDHFMISGGASYY
jgi:hypothetical protein